MITWDTDRRRVIVGNDVGVWESPYPENDNFDWREISYDLPNTIITDLVYHQSSRALIAATYGRSLFRLRPEIEREVAALFGESGVADVPPVPWLPVEAFGRAIDALIGAANGGSASPLDVRFGAEVVRILAAAAESISEGRTVKLG